MPGNFAGHFGFGTYINVITINSNNKNVGYIRKLICYNRAKSISLHIYIRRNPGTDFAMIKRLSINKSIIQYYY
jgi:hypothetical protein